MITSNKTAVQHFVAICIAQGLKNVVISPGSRNAPLIIAFEENPEITCTVIHDERSAGFYALGMAQQLNAPVAVVCTSGSAVLNYYPAVAEAYYQCVPLVVISADRPSAWIDQGDGQTIVQNQVFTNHIRFQTTLSDQTIDSTGLWAIERNVNQGFLLGNGNWKGPIHFNFGFTEPLYGVSEQNVTLPVKQIKQFVSEPSLDASSEAEIKNIWESSKKKLILCGQMPVDKGLLTQLIELGSDPSVAILVENNSNLVHANFIHCIDRTLALLPEENLDEYTPDLLITIGGAVVSKKIKDFIRNHKPRYHFRVGHEFPFMDTYQSLTHTFEFQASYFIKRLHQIIPERNVNDFGSKWKQLDYLAQNKLVEFYSNLPFCDLKVFETVLDYIPELSSLHMANSSVVRYCQLFDPVPSISYWSNRGTSGIDGSSSTACGAASVKPQDWNTLITGDLSFFYDSNALWNSKLTANLRIVLINNQGGGIFKIIPGPDSTNQLEKSFVAQHQFSAEYICKAYQIKYFKADSVESIENQMEEFYTYEEEGRPMLMEIHTPSDENPKQLKAFFDCLKS
jgi:2-succinyl-5-enolpyruvyl-6-hydroxy-3-cyclohexene-1-carboxylate synthase